jgi:NHL repeat-containing protein
VGSGLNGSGQHVTGGRSRIVLLLAAAVLMAAICAAGAVADEAETDLLPSADQVAAAIQDEAPGEVGGQGLTDPAAAQGVELENLNRAEALMLMTGVFSEQVEAPAGIYDELQESHLLGSNVAVIPAQNSEPDEAGEQLESSQMGEPEVSGNTLIDSTVPLRVPDGSGAQPIDLSLASAGGALEPVAPLVETRIPSQLGEGIELPGAGIAIGLAGSSEEREASVADSSVAFYPNVAQDSDLAISPTPGGVETLTQLRSAESPQTQRYELTLPAGTSLQETEAGGAEVRAGDEVLMTVEPPTAIDAQGDSIPVSLSTEGTAVLVQVNPASDASYPILVDPLWQTYEWEAKNTTAGICRNSFKEESSYSCNKREEWGYETLVYDWGGFPHLEARNSWGVYPGIFIHAQGQQRAGDHANVIYTVPRYFKETPVPTSYIKSLKLSDVTWTALGPSASPYLFMGIWNSSAPSWITYFSHTGQSGHGINEPAHVYEFSNPTDVEGKTAEVGIFDTEATASSNASVYVGAAAVELGDQGPPKAPIPVPQTKWVNQSASPLEFTSSDSGLGLYAMSAGTSEVNGAGAPLHSWKALNGCVGVGDAACPVTWKSSESGHPALTYEPGLLPTGIDYVALTAEDPVGNKSSTAFEQVKVDHQAPEVSVSGSLTEQASLGTKLSNYGLTYATADGDEAEAAALTPIGSAGTGTGQLQRPMGVAVDSSGNVWVVDRENNRVEEFDSAGTLVRQFGSLGLATGQFSDPRGIAISAAGNVWVSEFANKRL